MIQGNLSLEVAFDAEPLDLSTLSFGNLVKRFAPASAILGRHDDGYLAKVQVVGKIFMREQIRAFLVRASARPVLMVYGSDLTPMVLKHRTVAQINGRHEIREGNTACEWCVHRAYYLMLNDHDSFDVRTVFEAPVLMATKKTWDLYACAERLVPLLQAVHPKGISVSWYVFDRGCRSSLARALRRRHCLSHQRDDDLMASLTDWVLDSACSDHDVQNALCKGCCLGFSNTKGIFKSIFKAIRSVRDTFDKLIETIPEWVQAVEMEDEAFDTDEVRRCWEMVGVKQALAIETSEINLRYERGALRCHQKVFERDDPFGYIGIVVLALYKFCSFSSGRFLGLGASCGGLSAALMVGLDGHMNLVKSMPGASDYYMSGYNLLDAEARSFVVRSGVASMSTGKLHCLLLADDRVAKEPSKYLDALHSQLAKVNVEGSTLLYRRLSSHVPDMTGVQLESETLSACYASAGFTHRRVFDLVRSPLFEMCSGNIGAKVVELGKPTTPDADEGPLRKAQILVRLGYPIVNLVHAFRFIAEAPWSILRYEQMHGSGAAQKKLHREMGPATLSIKSASHMMLPMVRREEESSRRFVEDRRIDSLRRRQPEKSNGKGLALGEANSRQMAVLGEHALPSERLSASQELIARHAAEYKHMPTEHKLRFDQQAAVYKKQKRREIDAEISALSEKVDEKRQKLFDQRVGSPPWRAGLFGWTQEDLQQLDMMMKDQTFSHDFVAQERVKELYSPMIPSKEIREKMAVADDGLGEERPRDLPDWVRRVCKFREHFREIAFIFGEGRAANIFVLGYGSENPFWAVFIRLLATEQGEDGIVIVDKPACRQEHEFVFSVIHDKYYFEDEPMLFGPPTAVLPGLKFESKQRSFSDSKMQSFDEFVAAMPALPASSRAPRTKKHSDVDETLLSKHPWLRRVLGKQSFDTLEKKHRALDSTDAEMEMESLSDVNAAVAEARLAAIAQNDDANVDFVLEPRGGAWTHSMIGMAIDSYRGRPAAGVPSDWMQVAWPRGSRSVTCSIEKFGARYCIALCRLWCSMMQEWYNEWLRRSDGSVFIYSKLTVRTLMDADVMAEVDALPPSHPIVVRFRQLAKLVPLAP